MSDADEEKDRLADTNMENYGSKEHKDLRKKAAETEEAWKGAGDKAGLQIWRIEQFKVKHWPKDKYGEFFSGDSYIILQTIENEEGKSYNVFFWLGAETTQDEAGTAAYKTVELDDLLGDAPVQYREVQGNESQLFINLFHNIRVLPGGTKSGFRKVEAEEWEPYLLRVTGVKKNTQAYDVTKTKGPLNNSDCFILDYSRDKIYVFTPQKATAWEKRHANQEVQKIRGEPHRGKSKDIHIDGLEDTSEPFEEFWNWFGGKPKELAQDEEAIEANSPMKMIKVSDDSGKLECTLVHEGALLKEKLESDDAFILDTGISIYLWIGKTCKPEEKREAMAHVSQYLQENGRPQNIPVCRVLEGKEPKHFHAMMEDCADGKWDAKMMTGGFCGRKSSKAVRRDMK